MISSRTMAAITTAAARQPDVDRQRREEREEDELSGADAGAEDADHEAAVLDEPAVRDRRPEDARDEAAAEAGQEPEEDRHLPDLADEARTRSGRRRSRQAEQRHAADPERGHQPARIGPASPYVEQPDGGGETQGRVDQPGSPCIEIRNAPGAARTPAVANSTRP